ncbi:MAG TPA: glycosyltransferase family 4 protein [Myxococcota bacterium]|jgi:glycosyltransferase involved in cell wall biosynthesis|nr:glycosyltransferase family 4 protein [Myxococcota bacterium]
MHSGGQGIYLWFLARELARLGHAVSVLVGPPYPDPMPFARDLSRLPNPQLWGKRFHPDSAVLLPWPRPLRAFEPLYFYELAATHFGFLPEPFTFSVRALRALVPRLRAGERFDLLHDVQSLGYGLLALRAIGLPLVTTIHHPLSVDRRASFARDRTLREALGTMEFYPVGMQAFVARRLDRVLTSSELSRREIRKDFGVADSRIRNVGNGLDTELFRPLAAVPRASHELLCVGRASDPNKGIDTLLEALRLLPPEVRLTLVDEDHPLHLARTRGRELGVAERVTITGRVPQARLVELYNRATLVVVPSRYEGFGLPAAEAMACGTPVVASAAGALPELLRAGGGGTLSRVADPASLAAAIGGLLARSADARAALGREARARVVAAYSWARIAERTVEAYREVLAERARGRPARSTTSARDGAWRAAHPAA